MADGRDTEWEVVQPTSEFPGRHRGDRRVHGWSRSVGDGFHTDLTQFDVPTLILHGDDDQIVPIGTSAMRSRSS